jgi:Ca2+-binding EF-hand superfamily protein
MFIEEKILQENIMSRDHIDEIYNLFVILTENSQFKIIPLNFINVFHNISEKKSLNVDKESWNQIFTQIDYDKDGAISFQDFLRYVYNNFKIILGEVTENFSFNRIK